MSFEFHRAASVDEASELARRFAPTARFIAGGTDLTIQIHRRRTQAAHLIDISRLALAGVTEQPDGITLGALTTYRTIERHAAFRGPLRALAEAASVVGGHQVRNVATIAGNIANASPAADFVPPLLALDATVETNRRIVALRDLLLGPGKTALAADELITALQFASLPPHSATAFLKEGRRKAMEISVVCVAAVLTLAPRSNRIERARIALGAVAPTAIRSDDAERYLTGRTADSASFHEAGRLATVACAPIDDVRASAAFRRELVAVLVERALSQCVGRISNEGGRHGA